MALPEMCSPIREITTDQKRQIPEFKIQEEFAVERLLHPEVRRPVKPMYAFIVNKTAELATQPTSPGMDMWIDFRKAATDEFNYPRCTGSFEMDGVLHTTTLFHTVREAQETGYDYRLLRCSCCLPDYRLTTEVYDEYQPCPAKDMVIAKRAEVYEKIFGQHEYVVNKIRRAALVDALKFIMSIVQKDPLAWPPSHRNDQLLIQGIAPIFDMATSELHGQAKLLQEDNLVVLHGEANPSISIAA